MLSFAVVVAVTVVIFVIAVAVDAVTVGGHVAIFCLFVCSFVCYYLPTLFLESCSKFRKNYINVAENNTKSKFSNHTPFSFSFSLYPCIHVSTNE